MRTVKIALAFLGGALTAAAVFGFATAIDGGDDSDSGSPAAVATTAAVEDTGNGSEVSLAPDECMSAADIYEMVRPSVVEIDVISTSTGFFGSQQIQGTGSGVVLDEEGYILTNNHVVESGGEIEVIFSDGGTAPAEVIGADPANDLAVIKVDPADHELDPATLGDSAELRVGDPVLAIGAPFNLEGTLTQGIVSALDRAYSLGFSTRPLRGMIQTDAAINPGNSGGPLINCRGEVVGINTLLENPSGDSVNVGVAFAVAINTAKHELDELKAGEQIDHAWLGIAGQDLTPGLAQELDLTVDEGVYVTLVTDGGPADRAGLRGAFLNETQAQSADTPARGGDVITAADGIAMKSINQLATYLDQNKDPGDTVELTVVRDSETLKITATLAEWPNT